MKRIALALTTFAMMTAGAIVSAGPVGVAHAATLNRHAAQPDPHGSATRPAEQEPPPSIPYDPDGPAYMPGQTRSHDFQLQH